MLCAPGSHVIADRRPDLVYEHDATKAWSGAHGGSLAPQRAAAPALRELDAARAMQRSILPASLPRVRGCDVAALWHPAGAVGGDGYDVIGLSDTRLVLSIADVAGKGMPAALLMTHVLAMTRAYATVESSPRDHAARVNRALCGNAALETFVTSCHAVLDMTTRTLAVTNAGHTPPILVRAAGHRRSRARRPAGCPVRAGRGGAPQRRSPPVLDDRRH